MSEADHAKKALTAMMDSGQDTLNNRRKHSKEVAQIARNLGEDLGLDEKDILIAEIASLCHDLGHAPFGHTGQRVVARKLTEVGVNQNIADDNINSLLRAKEMKLPDRVIDSIVYHDGKPLKELGDKYNVENLGSEFDRFVSDKQRMPTISAQLSAISDDIANDSRDLRDIYRAEGAIGDGFALKEIADKSPLLKRVYNRVKEANNKVADDKLIPKIIKGVRKEYMSDVTKNYKAKSKSGEQNGIMIAFSENMQKEHDLLRQSMREAFKHPSFKRTDLLADKSLSTVFDAFYHSSGSVSGAIDGISDVSVKAASKNLLEQVKGVNENSADKSVDKAKAIVHFIYTELDDRTCYDLSKTIDGHQRGNTQQFSR